MIRSYIIHNSCILAHVHRPPCLTSLLDLHLGRQDLLLLLHHLHRLRDHRRSSSLIFYLLCDSAD